MDKYFKPGTDNQKAGCYVEVGPNGKELKDARTCTIQKGDRLPATSTKGHMWKYCGSK